ncbi:hypothetical protein KPH14_011301 [Odynerus spinipes]|uniref:Uncharacterized protein n=1 Tax=Odynerus spinipes TaxID=1348599 RepID=A0AAD9R9I1_9HYME|nr:hypothetical protein KPH14_011301 [Odynerus spinipes]
MCFNSTRDTPQIQFFTFPTKEKYARIWAEACGKPELINKSKTSLKRYVLCAEHFEDRWFTDPKNKITLIKTEIPIPTIFKNNLRECISRQTNDIFGTNTSKRTRVMGNLHDNITCNTEEDTKSHISSTVENSEALCSISEINDITNSTKDCTISVITEPHNDDTLQEDVEKLCRLCALPTSSNMLCSIYDQDMDIKINTILPLQLEVYKYDGLPQEICHLCAHKVTLCYDLIQQFLDANSKLLMHRNERDQDKGVKDNLFSDTPSETSLFSGKEPKLDDVYLNDDNYQNVEITSYHTYTPMQKHKQEIAEEREPENSSTYHTEHSYNLPLRSIPERTNPSNRLKKTNVEDENKDVADTSSDMQYNIVKEKLYNKKNYVCKTCPKMCNTKSELYRHNETHTEEKRFYCAHCPKSFRVKALLKQHMCSHSGTRPYVCDICGASYNRRGNMGQHRKTHFVIENGEPRLIEEGIRCSICRKKVTSLLMLKYHLAKHSGEKKAYVCTVCGKCFSTGSQLKVHQFLHTGERPYICRVCGKGFRTEAIMKQHYLALHTDEHPHECPFCDRKFKRLQSLIVHKRTHTGERPFPCPICGRAFAQKGDMMKHTRIHNPDAEKRVKKENSYLKMQIDEDENIQIGSAISEEITIFEIEDDGMSDDFDRVNLNELQDVLANVKSITFDK